jgi:hypothetical protein
VANQKKVLVEKLADKFQKKQMFFKAECCASGRIYSGVLRINFGSGIINSDSVPEGFILDSDPQVIPDPSLNQGHIKNYSFLTLYICKFNNYR